ncbi:MAG: polar amino acid transport system permease protein [Thermomicrobiales bacterium]|jgi:polar amino acid transport system permease protein|nr:polar amino acid transport system permease protein [Thermomicrobiales bacterium]
MGFKWREIPDMMPSLLHGLRITVEATVIIMIIAMLVALPIALARMSRHWYVRVPATVYVQVLRGTPVLLQLFYLYYVLPFAGIRLDPWPAGVIGMSLAYSAYLSEIYRAGIEAIERGQTEAALALGMSHVKVMRVVVLPQAFRIVIPPIGNMFIGLFKDTSLLSILTLRELMFEGQLLAATTFRHITIFTVIAVLYLSVCWPSAAIIDRLERRLKTLPRDRDPAEGGRRRWVLPFGTREAGA